MFSIVFCFSCVFISEYFTMKQKYIKLSEYAKNNAVTYRTAWNRYRAGKLKNCIIDETNHILVPLYPQHDPSTDNNAIIYARVSNNDRKKELDYQLNRLSNYTIKNGYKIVDQIKEIASGMNDSRPKLLKLLTRDDWDVLIIENKDRLTRFGFNYIETLLNIRGKKIEVINQIDDDKNDIINDLVSIIYSFSARIYGLRKKKNKQEVIEFLEK